MPELSSFEYCVIRVVPFVERQEFLNAGVVLHCKKLDFLGARMDPELRRLQVFSPETDLKSVRELLDSILKICAGGDAAGYFGSASKSERFNWIAAKSSTIIQASTVHCGICEHPQNALSELYARLVGDAG